MRIIILPDGDGYIYPVSAPNVETSRPNAIAINGRIIHLDERILLNRNVDEIAVAVGDFHGIFLQIECKMGIAAFYADFSVNRLNRVDGNQAGRHRHEDGGGQKSQENN